MPNLTVSSPVDVFMQSADAAGMRAAIGVATVQNLFTATNGGNATIPAGTTAFVSDVAGAGGLTTLFTITLPLSSGYPIGARLLVSDVGLNLSATSGATIGFALQGADSIQSYTPPDIRLVTGWIEFVKVAADTWGIADADLSVINAQAQIAGQEYASILGLGLPVQVVDETTQITANLNALTFKGGAVTAVSAGPGVVVVTVGTVEPTDISLRDDFVGGAATSGSIGTLDWSTAQFDGDTGFISSYQLAVTNHPGIFQLATGIVLGGGISMYLGGSSLPSLIAFINTDFRMVWVFKLNQNTLVGLRLGLGNGTEINDGVQVNRWFGLRFDSALGDANFMFVTKDGGAENAVSSGVAVNTGWHTLRVKGLSASSLEFQLDSAAPVTISTQVITGASQVMPVCGIVTGIAATRSVDVDYFGLYANGFTR